MKIFNVENTVEKVYVQVNDILMLKLLNCEMPKDIKLLKTIMVPDKRNTENFVEFDQPEEVEFFRNLDWIIDYKQFRNLKENEIKKIQKELVREIENINVDENKNDKNLLIRQRLLSYQVKSIDDLLLIKQGYKQITFPLVPDSDAIRYTTTDSICEIRPSLDPNKLLFYRPDGVKLPDLTGIYKTIYKPFIDSSISKYIDENIGNNLYTKDYKIVRLLSEDGKFLIIEFKAKDYEQEETTKSEKGPKKIKDLFKRMFNN